MIKKHRRNLIIVGSVILVLLIFYLLYLIGGIAQIPLTIAAIVLYGLVPFSLGALAALIIRKFSMLIGGLTAVLFLLLWQAYPYFYWMWGREYVSSDAHIFLPNLLTGKIALSVIWYAGLGAIGGKTGNKLRKKTNTG